MFDYDGGTFSRITTHGPAFQGRIEGFPKWRHDGLSGLGVQGFGIEQCAVEIENDCSRWLMQRSTQPLSKDGTRGFDLWLDVRY